VKRLPAAPKRKAVKVTHGYKLLECGHVYAVPDKIHPASMKGNRVGCQQCMWDEVAKTNPNWKEEFAEFVAPDVYTLEEVSPVEDAYTTKCETCGHEAWRHFDVKNIVGGREGYAHDYNAPKPCTHPVSKGQGYVLCKCEHFQHGVVDQALLNDLTQELAEQQSDE